MLRSLSFSINERTILQNFYSLIIKCLFLGGIIIADGQTTDRNGSMQDRTRYQLTLSLCSGLFVFALSVNNLRFLLDRTASCFEINVEKYQINQLEVVK